VGQSFSDDLLLRDEQAEKFKCAVCLEVMLEPVTLTCGHAICKPCATRILGGPKARPGVRSTRKCPTCRKVSRARKAAVVASKPPSFYASHAS
jgi:hypothetical protein